MNAQNKNVTERIADALELPKDVVCGFMYLHLWGDGELTIDNHMGVSFYEEERIIIRTKHGPVKIEGKDLKIAAYNKDFAKINGQISDICFLR